jgi:hypothetical protein
MVRLRKAVVFYSKSGVAPKSKRAIEKGQKEPTQTEYQKAKQLDPLLKPLQ